MKCPVVPEDTLSYIWPGTDFRVKSAVAVGGTSRAITHPLPRLINDYILRD
jgi:hypothetical protein